MTSDLGFPRNGDVPIASKRPYKRLGSYGLWAGKGLHPTTPDVTQGLLLVSFEWQPSFNLLLRQARGFNDKSLLLIFYLPGISEDYDIGLSFYLFGHENWKYFYDQIINVNRLAVSPLLAKNVQRCAQIKYYPNWYLYSTFNFPWLCTHVSLCNTCSLSINRMRPQKTRPCVKMGVAR